LFDPYMAQRMAEEYIKDALREAEQERLIRQAEHSRQAWSLWPLAALTLGALLVFIALQS